MNDDRVALKEQVKAANDIVAVVGNYVTLRPAGPTYKGLCPFHDDRRPSFDVDPRRQRYRCWACNKFGDVISFVQEYERVSFQEALELLARRAGISLENLQKNSQGPGRAAMLDVMRWAAEQFQSCLLDSPQAEAARKYLGERKLTGETVRLFGLGFAPPVGGWLVQKAVAAKLPLDVLETVGLIARQPDGREYYGRFRDRVMFPIRDIGGRVVGFGGRIMPSSASADRVAKYINSAETPLFSKSDQLYGIDLARQPATKAGYLAIVEGYTDVMMAHQHGIAQVVATMGTALNARHVRKLANVTRKVVLVFDADAGGDTGVERAMEVFVSHDVDLRIAALPEGLDPCDLLVQQGPEPFRQALEGATDVFEYQLQRVWAKHETAGVEGQRRASEELLTVMAAAPDERSVKLELMVNRIAHRLRVKEETLWSRLRELRAKRKAPEREALRPASAPAESTPAVRQAPAVPHERELIEILLAEPALVATAQEAISAEDVEHPGLRRLLEGLYELRQEGRQPDLDQLLGRLDNERLSDSARKLQDRGLDYPDRPGNLQKVLARFRERRETRRTQSIKDQLKAALQAGDQEKALALQRQLRNQPDR